MLGKLEKVPGKNDTVMLTIDKHKTPLTMTYVKSEATRKKLDLMIDNIAKNTNIPILDKLIHKRDKVAKMLGYSSNAEMVLRDKMAKNIENVEKLLDDLIHRVTPLGRKELQDLTDYKRSLKGHEDDTINKWDYYDEIIQKYDEKVSGYEENDITPYFPAEHVKNETMNIY